MTTGKLDDHLLKGAYRSTKFEMTRLHGFKFLIIWYNGNKENNILWKHFPVAIGNILSLSPFYKSNSTFDWLAIALVFV